MISGIPKVSVLIICYKQEELIKRAINSLLIQKDYIYEICVSDDCSPDRTWEVLQEYDKKHPGLFKLHRNSSNVGIFENIEYTWSMPTGDIIYRLAGDDECGEGWLKTVIDYIQHNKIDYKTGSFCIYGDYQVRKTNGDIQTIKNDCVLHTKDIISDAIRWKLCNRSCCYSKNVILRFQKVSQGKSYIAESAQDRQLQLFSKHNYYLPYVGNIYYSSIGVSTKLNKEGVVKERASRMSYLIEVFANFGYHFSCRDKIFCHYVEKKELLMINNSILNKLHCIVLLLLSYTGSIKNLLIAIKQILTV